MAVKNTMVLTYHQVSTIASALRVAAEEYDRDATNVAACSYTQLAEQFERQAVEARGLADRLEQADSLSLAA